MGVADGLFCLRYAIGAFFRITTDGKRLARTVEVDVL